MYRLRGVVRPGGGLHGEELPAVAVVFQQARTGGMRLVDGLSMDGRVGGEVDRWMDP